MKKTNDPKNVVDEMVDGLVRAYPQFNFNYRIPKQWFVVIKIQCGKS